jgi:hypothetical protein
VAYPQKPQVYIHIAVDHKGYRLLTGTPAWKIQPSHSESGRKEINSSKTLNALYSAQFKTAPERGILQYLNRFPNDKNIFCDSINYTVDVFLSFSK